MKEYYWQDLPPEIQQDFWSQMGGTHEEKDHYINTHNFAQTLGEWEKTIEEQEEEDKGM